MTNKSKQQQEYDALPEWARALVDAVRPAVGYGIGCTGTSENKEWRAEVRFRGGNEQAAEGCAALAGVLFFAQSLSAPWPPAPPEARSPVPSNVVEIAAFEGDCAFDQTCAFGYRVEHHAVYCEHSQWPDHPRKCRRDRALYRHEDCPGFTPNENAPASG